MIRLEVHVCSRAWAEQLRDMGIPQQSEYTYYRTGGNRYQLAHSITMLFQREQAIASAFTIAELVALLGDRFGVLERFHDGTFGAYVPHDIGTSAVGDHIPDVLAELLCKTHA